MTLSLPCRVVVLLGVLAATVVACGDDGGDPSGAVGTSTVPPVDDTSSSSVTVDITGGVTGDVDVFVEFPRYLHAQRLLEVGFDNGAADDLVVTEWAVRSPLFEDVPASTGHSTIPARQRRDLKVDFGPAVCPAPDGPSSVAVTLTLGTTSFEGSIEIDPAPLERIHRSECGQQLVHETADLAFSEQFTVADDTLTTSLDASLRVDDQPVVIDGVRGSVILEIRPVVEADPLATVDASAPTASIPMHMRVIRCDPHAVTESKKTFQFATWVSIGDGEPIYTVVEATGGLREELQRLIDECVLEEFAQANG